MVYREFLFPLNMCKTARVYENGQVIIFSNAYEIESQRVPPVQIETHIQSLRRFIEAYDKIGEEEQTE